MNVRAATSRTTTPCSVSPPRCLTSTTSSAKQKWLNQVSMLYQAVASVAAVAVVGGTDAKPVGWRGDAALRLPGTAEIAQTRRSSTHEEAHRSWYRRGRHGGSVDGLFRDRCRGRG